MNKHKYIHSQELRTIFKKSNHDASVCLNHKILGRTAAYPDLWKAENGSLSTHSNPFNPAKITKTIFSTKHST